MKRLGGLAPAKCPSYDLSGEVCTHERAPRGLHTRGLGSHEALPSPQPTSHTERIHARLGGKAALLKPLSGELATTIARSAWAPVRIAPLPWPQSPSIPQHRQGEARQRDTAAARALRFPHHCLGADQQPQARGTRRPRAH